MKNDSGSDSSKSELGQVLYLDLKNAPSTYKDPSPPGVSHGRYQAAITTRIQERKFVGHLVGAPLGACCAGCASAIY